MWTGRCSNWKDLAVTSRTDMYPTILVCPEQLYLQDSNPESQNFEFEQGLYRTRNSSCVNSKNASIETAANIEVVL
jgi:hypothetical protein